MRQAALCFVVCVTLLCGGCNRAKTVADFPLRASMTQDELEEIVGSPTRISASTYWWGYILKDGTELRVYFLTGPKGGIRTLTSAVLYSASGTRLKVVFELPKPVPTTVSVAGPETEPATLPASAQPATTLP